MTVKIAFIMFTFTIVKFTSADKMSGFIVGGNYSDIEQFPYAVYISKNCSNRNSSCGASVLNQVLLLSAAHCYVKCFAPFSVNAYTGSVTKFHGIESKVVSFSIHEKYNHTTKANDIAILKLEIALTFGIAVKRVAVMKEPPEAEVALVSGWGWVDSKGTRGSNLKHARQFIIDYETCYERLYKIPEGTICGKDGDGLSYPEKGDSGSALVIHDYIQIGLVSFKKRSIANDTIVYTYVPYYYDWIIENAERLYCKYGGDVPLHHKKRINRSTSHANTCSLSSVLL